jgi:GINS complex subunit 1
VHVDGQCIEKRFFIMIHACDSTRVSRRAPSLPPVMSADTRQYGDLATQLVTESKRSTGTDTLLKYNDPLVRAIIREQRQLEQLLQVALVAQEPQDDSQLTLADAPTELTVPLLVYQTAINRNKRCLLAYHSHRLDRLRAMYWAVGGALPHLLSSEDTRSKLSPHEVDFLRSYNASILDFRTDYPELDIMASVDKPPKDLHVLVRVVRDCGTIQTELGAIDFRKGQRFMVRRADVEHLIVQGYLEEV